VWRSLSAICSLIRCWWIQRARSREPPRLSHRASPRRGTRTPDPICPLPSSDCCFCLEGGSQAYHIAWGLRVEGALDHAALRRSLDRILSRHEALRTTFAFEEGQLVQRSHSAHSRVFALGEHDLSADADTSAQLACLGEQKTGAAFALERGPLIRGRLIRLSPEPW
jgi:hypothetical protein